MSDTRHHRGQHYRRYRRAPRWFNNLRLDRPRRRQHKAALAHYVRGGEDPVENGKTNSHWDWS